MSKNLPLNHKRIFGLDLLRATAILLVMLHHGFQLFPFPFPPVPDGVDIFFVLSGYLIGGILIKTVEKKQDFSWSDLKTFWFRRWFRTLPAFWVTLLINLIIYFFINLQTQTAKDTFKLMFVKEKLWEYFFFIQNFATNLKSRFFAESWSLSVEEWFYLLLPVFIFFSIKSGLKPLKAIFLSILIIIVVPILLRFSFSDIHLKLTWLSTRMVVVMRLDSIGCGVLMAFIRYYKPKIWDVLANYKSLILLGAIIFYGSFLIIFMGHEYLNSSVLTNLFFYTFTNIGVMIAIPAMSKMMAKDTVFEKVITFISLTSYSIYLLNYSIIVVLIQIIRPNPATRIEEFISLMAYLIVTFGASYLMYRFVEQPFMRLRDKYFSE
jgi:peptidoglycan/LPS O-acetylase OafA/YrhL